MNTLQQRLNYMLNIRGLTIEDIYSIPNLDKYFPLEKSKFSSYINSSSMPSLEDLRAMCNFLGCSNDFIMGSTDKINNIPTNDDRLALILRSNYISCSEREYLQSLVDSQGKNVILSNFNNACETARVHMTSKKTIHGLSRELESPLLMMKILSKLE